MDRFQDKLVRLASNDTSTGGNVVTNTSTGTIDDVGKAADSEGTSSVDATQNPDGTYNITTTTVQENK